MCIRDSYEAVRIIGQYFIEPFDDGGDSCIHAGSHMGTGVEDEYSASHGGGTGEFQPEKVHGQFIGCLLYTSDGRRFFWQGNGNNV